MTEDKDVGDSTNVELIGKAWQELVKDINHSESYIQLQQLLSRQVRDKDLRGDLRAFLIAVFKKKYSREKAKYLFDMFFYPEILEGFSISADKLSQLQQISLRVSANSTLIAPPTNIILDGIYGKG